MRLRLLLAVFAALSLALVACGGSDKYMVPTDSKVKPFKAPTTESLSGEDDDWDVDMDDTDGADTADEGNSDEGDQGSADESGDEGGNEDGVEGGVPGGTTGGAGSK